MKKLNVILIATVLVVLMSPARSAYAEWKELGSNAAMVVYVDLATISDNGEKSQIMSMLDFKAPGKNPNNMQTVNSIVGLNEYNCAETSYRPIAWKEFSEGKGTGKVVSDNNTPDSKFEPVVNDTWTAGVFNVACRKR